MRVFADETGQRVATAAGNWGAAVAGQRTDRTPCQPCDISVIKPSRAWCTSGCPFDSGHAAAIVGLTFGAIPLLSKPWDGREAGGRLIGASARSGLEVPGPNAAGRTAAAVGSAPDAFDLTRSGKGILMNHCLRAELIEMQDEDQRLRWRALEAEGEPAAAAWAAVGELDRRHTIRMREIVAEHGWPGLTLVGVDGAHAAWLLAQHADHDHDFQRECLVLLDAAVDAGEAEAIDQAYLEDRVAVAEDRPQRYGTQFRRGGEGFVPAPIVDDKDVDQRRAALGLCPLAEYAASINQPRQSRKV